MMWKKKSIWAGLLVGGLLWAACATEPVAEPVEVLLPPSKLRIEQIFRPYKTGDYLRFVNYMYGYKNQSERFQSQLVNMLKLQEQQRGHDSLRVMDIQPAQIVLNEPCKMAEVYLNFSYANGTSEEVMVPFIYQQGQWWLR